MTKVNNDLISIITFQSDETGEKHAMFTSSTKMVAKCSQLSAQKLSDNLLELIKTLSTIVEKLPESCGYYDVDELTFSLSIDGSGKISLIGELSAGFTSGITITLKKKKDV